MNRAQIAAVFIARQAIKREIKKEKRVLKNCRKLTAIPYPDSYFEAKEAIIDALKDIAARLEVETQD